MEGGNIWHNCEAVSDKRFQAEDLVWTYCWSFHNYSIVHISGENRFGDEGLFFFYNNSSSFKPSIGLANAIRFVNQCRQQWELDQGIWKDTPPCIDFYLKCQTDQMFGEELDHICTYIIILNNSDNSLGLGDCCFTADIWFAETHCFVLALACSCQQKPEPDGQPAKPFISLQNCNVL